MERPEPRPAVNRRQVMGILTLTLIVLLAAALRFHRLGAQSFWNDEGNSARLVERSIRLILEGAAGDIHPPGYYLALHSWRAWVGGTEFALRAYSVLCGVLTVSVAAAIGRRMGGWTTALGTALILALHPLAVYYSQEARMYAQLGLTVALTLDAAVRLVGRTKPGTFPNPATVAVLALSVTAGLYTQYAYGFALLGLNLAFGLAWLIGGARRWRMVVGWIGAHLAGALLFIPWAPIALRARGWSPPDLAEGSALRAVARASLAGITLPEEASLAGAWIAAGLLLLLALATRPRNQFAKWAALGTALATPALLITLGIYRPAYLKFLMASVPALAPALTLPLSISGGPKRRNRPVFRWGRVGLGVALLAVGVLPVQIRALDHLYTDPTYRRDDYRGIAAHIEAQSRRGDAILLSAPNQWEVFTYYYQGEIPVYPAPYRPTESEAATWVAEIIDDHERLFVLYWGDRESDPKRTLERALAEQAYKAEERWVTSVRVARYGTGPQSETPQTPLGLPFEEGLTLEGATVPKGEVEPGAVVPLTLFWHTDPEGPTPDRRLKVFVHLLGAEGQLVAQTDMEPIGGLYPTDRWLSGERVIDRHGVSLPPDVVPGTYTLITGLYDFSGERLTLTQNGGTSADHVPLGTLTVAPPQ